MSVVEMMRAIGLGLGLAGALGACSDDPAGVPDGVELGPVVVTALDGPVPVLAEGEIQVVYELDVTNPPGNPPVRLAELTVEAGPDLLVRYAGSELRNLLTVPDIEVESGRGIYLWFSFAPDRVPSTLTHTLSFDGTDETRRVVVEVVERELPVVKPPLTGEDWVAVGIGNDAPHRRAVYATPDGRWLPQRFAVDWVKVDQDQSSFVGDPRDNRSYYAYGEPVLAVADGRILHVEDGIPENIPGSLAIEITLDNLGGNTVTQQLADGTDVFYAHFVPGSIRVGAGDVVQAGDTLGLVGNSGNSTEPHLHIHFARTHDYALSAAKADGLPYVFESFEILANRPVLGMRFGEMPLDRALVRFE